VGKKKRRRKRDSFEFLLTTKRLMEQSMVTVSQSHPPSGFHAKYRGGRGKKFPSLYSADSSRILQSGQFKKPELREKIIWNFDNVQKAYATRGYEAKETRTEK
jgi:hypothetical protein